jgi:hypothetical protein
LCGKFKGFLIHTGAVIIKDIQQVPTGLNMIIKHNDGVIFEYVEHKKL